MEHKIDVLLAFVKKRVIAKAELYDGYNSTLKNNACNVFVRSCIEELGEVASAYTRQRLELAKQECIDVIQSAMYLYFAIEAEQENNKEE